MQEPQESTDSVPLAVDLDGTLSLTDTLHEALLAIAREDPLTLLKLPGWLSRGRAHFKAQVADRRILSADELPLNQEVIDLVKDARSEGRKTILVSAANERQVRAIAEHVDLFDEAVGSTGERNLKGRAKAEYLVETFGKNGFDYIGDSVADLEVWGKARKPITVNAAPRVRSEADRLGGDALHIGSVSKGPALMRAMRPHQWLKNLLVFLPVLAAHDPSGLPLAFLAFVAFSLTASSAYLINDLLDLHADRVHPRKRSRSLASGALSLSSGVVASAGLLLLGLTLALLFGGCIFFGVILGYFTITLVYSFYLKRKLIIDILTLAGLYTLRIIGGAVATATFLSPWMLGFSVFLFLCLAAIKRQAELQNTDVGDGEIKGRAYALSDLPIVQGIAISAAHAAVLIFALYINSTDVQELYGSPQLLWLVAPLLLYWLLRMVMKTHRGMMHDDPIVFASRDPTGAAVVLVSLAVFGMSIP